MASFCSGCGFPQGPGVTFCQNCGARQQTAAAAPAPAATPLPSSGMGAGLKVVLVLVVLMFVAGAAVIGGLYYAAHRVKEAVVEKAKSYGVELPADTPTRSSATRTRLPKPCDALSKQEAADLIGEPIERAEPAEEGCSFYGPAGLATRLAGEQASSTMRKNQAPGAKVNAGEVATAMDNLLNSVAAENSAANGKGGEMPLLMLMLDPDGKAQMTALNMAKGIFGGIVSASGSSESITMGTEIPGLGDRAVRLPKLGLNILKGEVLIRIVPGPIPDADAKTISVARTVLARL